MRTRGRGTGSIPRQARGGHGRAPAGLNPPASPPGAPGQGKEPAILIVYGINLSTFTRKVRLALAEKGLEYRLEVAPMGSPKVRALHPLGKIPVLEDDGKAIPDSSVIIAYLERAYPGVPLYPGDPRQLADALWLEEYADSRLREATVPWFAENVVKPVFQGRAADADSLARAAPLLTECCDYLESWLRALPSRDAPFLVGDCLGVADIAVGVQFVTAFQGGAAVPDELWPRLARYLARLQARPAWAALLAEETQSLAAARERGSGKAPSA